MHCRHSSPALRKCARPSQEIASESLFLVLCHHRPHALKRPKSGGKARTNMLVLLEREQVEVERPLLILKRRCWSPPMPVLEKMIELPFRKKPISFKSFPFFMILRKEYVIKKNILELEYIILLLEVFF